jgi:hypothetical protein
MLAKLTTSKAERVARAILTKLKAKKAVRLRPAAQAATASADERKALYAAEEQEA